MDPKLFSGFSVRIFLIYFLNTYNCIVMNTVLVFLGEMLSEIIQVLVVVYTGEILYMSLVEGSFCFSYVHQFLTFFAMNTVHDINSGAANITFGRKLIALEVLELITYLNVRA